MALPKMDSTGPDNSYDNTGALGHSTWRHVKFVEGDPQPGFGGNAARSPVVGVLL